MSRFSDIFITRFSGKGTLELPPDLRNWIDKNFGKIAQEAQRMRATPEEDDAVFLGPVTFFNPYTKSKSSVNVALLSPSLFNKKYGPSGGVSIGQDFIAINSEVVDYYMESVLVHEFIHALDPKLTPEKDSHSVRPEEDKYTYYNTPHEFDARMSEIYSAMRRNLIKAFEMYPSIEAGKAWLETYQQIAVDNVREFVHDLGVLHPDAEDFYFSNKDKFRLISQKVMNMFNILKREIPTMLLQLANSPKVIEKVKNDFHNKFEYDYVFDTVEKSTFDQWQKRQEIRESKGLPEDRADRYTSVGLFKSPPGVYRIKYTYSGNWGVQFDSIAFVSLSSK